MKREFQSGSGERGGEIPRATRPIKRSTICVLRPSLPDGTSLLAAALRRAFVADAAGGRMTPNPSCS